MRFRGRLSFNELVKDSTMNHIPILEEKEKKGRSKKLLEARNMLLISRYWFYINYSKLRFEKIMNCLEEEFFLSSARISDIISQDDKIIMNLRNEKPSIKTLSELYPFFKWKIID